MVFFFFSCRGLQDMEDALLTAQAVMPNLAEDADEGANSQSRAGRAQGGRARHT